MRKVQQDATITANTASITSAPSLTNVTSSTTTSSSTSVTSGGQSQLPDVVRAPL